MSALQLPHCVLRILGCSLQDPIMNLLSPLCHLHRQIVNVHLQCFIARCELVNLLLNAVDPCQEG